MEKTDVEERVQAIKSAFESRIQPQEGLSYRLDLQIGSEMHSALPYHHTLSLPLRPCGYGYFIAGPNHFTSRKALAGQGLYQIFITYSGNGRFIIEGKEYIVGPNTLFMLKCDSNHEYKSLNGIWEHEWVNFKGLSCQAYYELINPSGPMVYDLGSNHEIPSLFHEVSKALEKTDMVSYVHASTRIIQLLDAVYTHIMEQKRINMADRRGNVERSVKYIEDHYMDKITLDDLARIAYLSKYYYTRAFNKYVGMSPYEYLNAVRISKAMNLLIVTDLSVDEVGWKTGFQGSRNLIRQFKKNLGITPREYRKDTSAWWRSKFIDLSINPGMKEMLEEHQNEE